MGSTIKFYISFILRYPLNVSRQRKWHEINARPLVTTAIIKISKARLEMLVAGAQVVRVYRNIFKTKLKLRIIKESSMNTDKMM